MRRHVLIAACTVMLLAALASGSSTAAVASVCGDGIVDPPETCDDGNVADGDGCSAECRTECPEDLCACLGAAS
jgi:cysteine-rich repeat protein